MILKVMLEVAKASRAESKARGEGRQEWRKDDRDPGPLEVPLRAHSPWGPHLPTEFLPVEFVSQAAPVAEVALTTWVPHKPTFHHFADISKIFDTIRKLVSGNVLVSFLDIKFC